MWKRYLQKEAANTTEKSNRPVLYVTCIFLIFLENTPIVFFLCKIYREKTIEVGVYIDRHLYKNMEEVFVQVICSSFYPKRIHTDQDLDSTKQSCIHISVSSMKTCLQKKSRECCDNADLIADA